MYYGTVAFGILHIIEIEHVQLDVSFKKQNWSLYLLYTSIYIYKKKNTIRTILCAYLNLTTFAINIFAYCSKQRIYSGGEDTWSTLYVYLVMQLQRSLLDEKSQRVKRRWK